jgi:hypothetical protein
VGDVTLISVRQSPITSMPTKISPRPSETRGHGQRSSGGNINHNGDPSTLIPAFAANLLILTAALGALEQFVPESVFPEA